MTVVAVQHTSCCIVLHTMLSLHEMSVVMVAFDVQYDAF